MDGWETRRRREPGHDWCIVRLGLPGVVHGVVVDTAFFSGNYPSHCWIDACAAARRRRRSRPPTWSGTRSSDAALAGDAPNAFGSRFERRATAVTHLRLNIFPDGGVARLRVLRGGGAGLVRVLAPGARDRSRGDRATAACVLDMQRHVLRRRATTCSCRTARRNMRDGWETRRRRGPGHDWAVIRLGLGGIVRRIELTPRISRATIPTPPRSKGRSSWNSAAACRRMSRRWRSPTGNRSCRR